MGGKTNTTTQQVQIPADVLARYNSVNSQAQTAAGQPFQVYSANPNAFVAPLTATQNAGVAGTNAAATEAQHYYGQATNWLDYGAQAVQPYYQQAGADISNGQGIANQIDAQVGTGISNAQNVGAGLANASYGSLLGANASAAPLNAAAGADYTAAYNGAQPYNAGATGLALAGAAPVNASQLTPEAIQQYLSPYLSTVLGGTSALLNQNNQQQQAGQLGNAISQGAFGGDRAGIAAANLEQQQNLANANIYSGILNTGYNTALSTAQQQQGVNLSAAQANRAALQNASGQIQGIGQQNYTQGMGLGSANLGLAAQEFGQGAQTASQEAALGQQQFGQGLSAAQAQQALSQQYLDQGLATASAEQGLAGNIYGTSSATSAGLANLGAGAQSAALQGAQAQLAAGQVQQQTQQAGLTALYNQFLQQQSYPFQVSQFLANIAEGTGALSGSTTSTTQPAGFFSDERLKEDIEKIGETYDGQNIVRFRYKGDPRKQIGLIAQDVEKRHPRAVGLAGGYRTVDYDEATQDAADRGHFRRGGLAANDTRDAYADGGQAYGTYDPAAFLAAQAQMYAPFSGSGLYGAAPGSSPRGGSSYVPQANLPVGRLVTAEGGVQRPTSPMEQANQIATLAGNIGKAANSSAGKSVGRGLNGVFGTRTGMDPIALDEMQSSGSGLGSLSSDVPDIQLKRGGLARTHLASGGAPYDGDTGLGLDIPDQAPDAHSLTVPGAPPTAGSSGASTALKTAADVAKIAAMFMARGGGVKDDGVPPPSDDLADLDRQSMALSLLRNGLADADNQDQKAFAAPGVSASPTTIAAPAPAVPEGSPAASAEPPNLARTLALIAKAEGTGKNPNSSAKGLYQIIDPTFVGAYRQMFPDQAQGMSKTQILALRETPEGDHLSAMMGPWLAKQNMGQLERAGFEPNAPSLYLAHFLGPDGAVKILGADPETPVDKLVSPQAVAENRSVLGNKTAGSLVQWAANRLQQMNRQTYAKGGGIRRGYADGGDPTEDSPDPNGVDQLSGGSRLAALDTAIPTDGPTVESAPSMPAQHSGWVDQLKKPEVFIPILAGLAAMGTAPTQHLGVALAAGLGAGAQAYQGQRQFQLEQQKTAQHGQEVSAYAGALGLKPQEVAISRYQAQTERLNAQMQALDRAQQIFDGNYSQISQVGPDGFPMYLNRLTGERLTQGQYSTARSRYLQTALGGVGTDTSSPLNAARTLGPPAGGDVGKLPDGVGNVAPGGAGPVIGDVGRVPAPDGLASGDLAPAPGARGMGAPGPLVPPSQGRSPPLPVNQSANLAEKLKSGAYLHPSVQLPPVDNNQLPENSNPEWLMQQGQALRTSGATPELRAQGEAYIAQAQNIMSGQTVPLGKDGQPYMGYVLLAQARTAANSVVQANAAQKSGKNDAASEFSNQLPAMAQLQNALIKVYRSYNTNRLSDAFSDLIGEASSIPGLRDAISPALHEYQSATDEAHKETARQAIVAAVTAGMASHAPASALRQANITVPNPSMAPGARYDLAAQQAALLRREQDYWTDWSRNKDRINDIASYDNDWTNEHPIGKYENWAYDQIAPFAGMTRQEMLQHPRHPKTAADLQGMPSGTPFVIPSGPRAGQIGYTP